METGEDREEQRPQTALTPPPVDCGDETLLRHLLAIELQRLAVAQQIEIDRETVFPETSVIIRDIVKLHQALNELRETENSDLPVTEQSDDTVLARHRAHLARAMAESEARL